MIYSETFTLDVFIDFVIAFSIVAVMFIGGRFALLLFKKYFPSSVPALQEKIAGLRRRRQELESVTPRDVEAIRQVAREIAGYEFDMREAQTKPQMQNFLPMVVSIAPIFLGNKLVSAILSARHHGAPSNILFTLPDGFLSGFIGRILGSRQARGAAGAAQGGVTTTGVAYLARQLSGVLYSYIAPSQPRGGMDMSSMLNGMREQIAQQQRMLQGMSQPTQ